MTELERDLAFNGLEILATFYLENNGIKLDFSKRDFMNAVIVFNTAIMDKLWENQEFDNMPMEEREKMAFKCGEDLRKLIFTYTNLDTHKIEEFI